MFLRLRSLSCLFVELYSYSRNVRVGTKIANKSPWVVPAQDNCNDYFSSATASDYYPVTCQGKRSGHWLSFLHIIHRSNGRYNIDAGNVDTLEPIYRHFVTFDISVDVISTWFIFIKNYLFKSCLKKNATDSFWRNGAAVWTINT